MRSAAHASAELAWRLQYSGTLADAARACSGYRVAAARAALETARALRRTRNPADCLVPPRELWLEVAIALKSGDNTTALNSMRLLCDGARCFDPTAEHTRKVLLAASLGTNAAAVLASAGASEAAITAAAWCDAALGELHAAAYDVAELRSQSDYWGAVCAARLGQADDALHRATSALSRIAEYADAMAEWQAVVGRKTEADDVTPAGDVEVGDAERACVALARESHVERGAAAASVAQLHAQVAKAAVLTAQCAVLSRNETAVRAHVERAAHQTAATRLSPVLALQLHAACRALQVEPDLARLLKPATMDVVRLLAINGSCDAATAISWLGGTSATPNEAFLRPLRSRRLEPEVVREANLLTEAVTRLRPANLADL
jgi:hypothetical protein